MGKDFISTGSRIYIVYLGREIKLRTTKEVNVCGINRMILLGYNHEYHIKAVTKG